jgi:hypothetical protein
MIQVPDDQKARQAVASLGGHLYQAVRAASAWTQLKPGEKLLLEVAEDYATLSGDILTMTQAKHEVGTVTLRNPGVRKALAGLIAFQNTNPGTRIRLVYLTTAAATREADSPLPDGESGIGSWQRAARGEDVEPLRQLLLETQTDPDLLQLVRGTDAETLRERLVEPVHWLTQSDGLAAATSGLEARLRELALARSGYADDGSRALQFLVYDILRYSVAIDRVLTVEDFERVWEHSTSVAISATLARQIMAQTASGQDNAVLFAQSPPLPPLSPRLAPRAKLVDSYLASLERADVLWLHGSARLGKSQLARLIAARGITRWTFVSLKDRTDAERCTALRDAIARIGNDDFGGLILDDLPVPASETLRHWIAVATLETGATSRGRIIVTSERAPLPQIRNAFTPLSIVTHEAAYLLLEDVADIVTASGGSADAWAGAIFLTCGSGHPLLVDARVAGLATRNWPADDRLAGLGFGTIPSEVAEAREEISLALLGELSADAHLLLLRLGGVFGPFDRDMVDAVAAISPPIARAGTLFTMLVGPWIELVAKDRFKLSALLTQAASDLSATDRAAIHDAIVGTLIKRNPFPADLLSPLLFHAMVSRSLNGFMFIVHAVMNSDRRALAPSLLPLTFMKSGENGRLVPESEGVSIMLRQVQLIVAVNLPDIGHASLLREALAENSQIQGILRDVNLYMIATTVLSAEGLELGADQWMPLLVRYKELRDGGSLPPELDDVLERTDLGGLTTDQFFFMMRSNQTKTIAALKILFDALDTIDPAWRAQLLKAGPTLLKGPPLFVQMAWSSEAHEKTLDADVGQAVYAALAAQAVGWGEREIAIECFRSRAVLFDEYLKRPDDALAVLDEAESLFPADARVQRSRATVLGNMGRHQEELDLLATLPPDYSVEEPLERIMMLRSAAISAGKAGDYLRAAQLFRETYELSLEEEPLTLGAGVAPGLLADAAVMAICGEDPAAALLDLSRSIERLEATDAHAEDVSYAFAQKAVDHVCQWACASVEGRTFPSDLSKTPGICSTLRPDVEAEPSPPRRPNQAWYLLARLEILLALDASIESRLVAREAQDGVVTSLAVAVSATGVDQALARADSVRLFAQLRRFTWLSGLLLTYRNQLEGLPLSVPVAAMTEPADWNDNEVYTARATVAGIVICLLLKDRPYEAAAAARQASAITLKLDGFLESVDPSGASYNDWMSAGVAAVTWLINHDHPSPDQLLQACVQIFSTLRALGLSPVSRAVHGLLVRHWLSLARDRKALLSTPRLAVPAIESAATLPSGLPAIARLIEAGSLGASLRLPKDLVDTLRATLDSSLPGTASTRLTNEPA